MSVFTITESGFKSIRKNWLLSNIIPVVVGLIVTIVLISINNKDTETLPYIIPFAILGTCLLQYYKFSKQQTMMESYQLSITDNEITMEMAHTKPVTISAAFLQEIVKHRNGNITVRGLEPGDIINIPFYIAQYEEVEKLLSRFKQFSAPATSFVQKNQLVLGLLMAAGMIGVFVSMNKLVVIISGAVAIPLFIWSIVDTYRNPNTTPKVKKLLWWSLLLVVSLVSNIIMKLTGMN